MDDSSYDGCLGRGQHLPIRLHTLHEHHRVLTAPADPPILHRLAKLDRNADGPRPLEFVADDGLVFRGSAVTGTRPWRAGRAPDRTHAILPRRAGDDPAES